MRGLGMPRCNLSSHPGEKRQWECEKPPHLGRSCAARNLFHCIAFATAPRPTVVTIDRSRQVSTGVVPCSLLGGSSSEPVHAATAPTRIWSRPWEGRGSLSELIPTYRPASPKWSAHHSLSGEQQSWAPNPNCGPNQTSPTPQSSHMPPSTRPLAETAGQV
ncbi:hypothetical protein BO70DRAFT_95645 [Aspergillus heteromorphus CBS 117.55]|uniref:Uncharacterized protein n=1 Tax=Aspergillus heteromorphus CBS 117.55 TaxID=1448321 RepID=A0A317VQS0_9EURO|nr:uncharacterized protein BO70DRAFT_95645 [Aspergillus heteromorphus CBS 117.55]PWY75377.1 hypothetical protein BO70DRAFT_95645 [Aspergillus heteromorphus CBS 117.55]